MRAGPRADLELVLLAVRQVGHEDFPDAAGDQAHRGDAAVPAVEVADQADAVGVRRPHGEVHAGGRPDDDAMRAELLERTVVRPLAEQVEIEVREHAAVAIRIVDLGHLIAGVGDPQTVIGDLRHRLAGLADEPRLEHARRIALVHRDQRVRVHEAQLHRTRRRLKRADDGRGAIGVRAQDGERVAVRAVDERRNGVVPHGLVGCGHLLDLIGIL